LRPLKNWDLRPAFFLCFLKELGVFERLTKSLTKNLRALGGDAGGSHNGPRAKTASAQINRRQPFLRFGNLVLVHQLIQSRNVRNSGVTLATGLQKNPDKTGLVQSKKRLASKKAIDGYCPALDLSPFKRPVLFRPSRIATDHGEF